MMMRLYHLEQILDRLHEVPKLVDKQAERSTRFPVETLEWLRATEQALEDARQSSVSSISALRSRLLRTMHGDGVERRSYKRTMSVASEVLDEAQDVVHKLTAPYTEQVAEAQKLAQQVVSVARVKGLVEAARQSGDHHAQVATLLSALQQDPDTRAATAHLSGLVGTFDVLVVLDRATPELH